jgi:SAM-dependent methyltransferase
VSDEAVTSELWGRTAREKSESEEWKHFYWQSHPRTLRHINRLITGDEEEDWMAFTKRRFLPDGAERGLSLGCGHGSVERDGIAIGLCRSFDGFDISEEALEVARTDAERAGVADRIKYVCADLNTLELGPDTYDLAIVVQALHHIEELEHVLDQVAAALRPGGLFLVNEYVGPARFQWLDKTQDLMNRLLVVLPHELKVNPRNGFIKDHIERTATEEIARVDPSESIRSDEIVELLRSRFEVVYHADYGGTLLQFLLADIAANFRDDEPNEMALLDLLSLFEETLVNERVLPSDFAFLVLRR